MRIFIERIIPLALTICLIIISPGAITADSDNTVIGFVGEEGQLFGDDGIIYEIAEDEKGLDLIEMAGRKVKVSGDVAISDEIIFISVTEFEVTNE